MREPIHVVTEDYEHYRKRKNRSDLILLGLFVIIAIVLLVYFSIGKAVKQNEVNKLIESSLFKCPMTEQELIDYMGREPDSVDKYGFFVYDTPNDYVIKVLLGEGMVFKAYHIPKSNMNAQAIANFQVFSCQKNIKGEWYVAQPYIS